MDENISVENLASGESQDSFRPWLEKRAPHEAPVLEWTAKYRRSFAATWKGLNTGEDVHEIVIVAEEE